MPSRVSRGGGYPEADDRSQSPVCCQQWPGYGRLGADANGFDRALVVTAGAAGELDAPYAVDALATGKNGGHRSRAKAAAGRLVELPPPRRETPPHATDTPHGRQSPLFRRSV